MSPYDERMLRSIARTPSILACSWPFLLAWYLGGTLVRSGIMALAAPIGAESALAALLLVPIAVLARLVSYIGMFLVLRSSLVEFRRAAGGNVSARSLRDGIRDFLEVLLVAIIPFFTLYTLIGQLQTDFNDYARSAFRYSGIGGNNVIDVGNGPLVVTVIVVALAARLILRRFGARLPRWVAIAEVYFEATWVFVALRGISSVFGDVTAFASSIRVVDQVLDARQSLIDVWEPIRAVFTGIDGLIPLLLQLVLLPLTWLLIAGLIYSRSLAGSIEENVLSRRLVVRLRAGVARLPRSIARQSYLVTDEWDDVGKPLSVAGKLILRAGALNLAVFAAVYSLIYVATQWATRGAYLAIGAHEYAYWINVYLSVLGVIAAVLEPIRITLLATAFDSCLSKRSGSSVQAAESDAASLSASDPVTVPSEI